MTSRPDILDGARRIAGLRRRELAPDARGRCCVYNALVISRGIREFVSRDWAAVRNSKDTYWAERITRLGPLEGLRIAEQLRRQALLYDAGWPHAAARREDLRFHVHLAERLRRATPTGRP